MARDQSVTAFITRNSHWQSELTLLREIALSHELKETIKWGAPAYTLQGKNVIGLGAFKSYVGIWFFQGGLLADKDHKLVNAQEGKTRAMRQWRFSSLKEIKSEAKIIDQYLDEAINNVKTGRQIAPSRRKPLNVPEDLNNALKSNNLVKDFGSLSLSKQRDYTEYIETAKKPETRHRRLDKIVPMIREGIGLNDQYSKK